MKQQTNAFAYLPAIKCLFTRAAEERGFPFGLGYALELDYLLITVFNHLISLYLHETE